MDAPLCLMARCWGSAARQATHPVRICICSSVTRLAGLLTPMAGGAAASIRGSITSRSHSGLHTLRSTITDRKSIPRAPRLRIHPLHRPAFWWMMADRILLRLRLNAGTILPWEDPRAGSYDIPGRALHLQTAPRNGICLQARTMASIPSTSESHRYAPPPRGRSIPSVTPADRTPLLSTRLCSQISTMSRMGGCTSADTTSMAAVVSTLNSRIGPRMRPQLSRIYSWAWTRSGSFSRGIRLQPR